MAPKLLIFAFAIGLVAAVASEPGLVAKADAALSGRDIVDNAAGDQIAIPAGDGCDCSHPVDGCQTFCGNDQDQGPIAVDQDALSPGTSQDKLQIPPVGLFPPRFLCDCSPPIQASCKTVCSNHGGAAWTPPNEARRASPEQIPLGHETAALPLPLESLPLPQDGCNCSAPAPGCQTFCGNHGGSAARDPNGSLDGSLPGRAQDGQHRPSVPKGSAQCNCSQPSADCHTVCGNHNLRLDGPDDDNGPARSAVGQAEGPVQQQQPQNASMAWPTEPFQTSPSDSLPLYCTSQGALAALSISGANGAAHRVAAAAELSSLASFIAHAAVEQLGLGAQMQPSLATSHSVRLHGSTRRIVGTVALRLAECGVEDLFYVLEPSSPAAADGESVAGVVAGLDLLHQLGALMLKPEFQAKQ